ncbi:hypothetical protein AYI69_g9616 [Smittium culicis]|uniref:Uncharacterized protein n=1 Tax=Smittium culicis TaxID=133412 RepID=A0A1R1XBJ4_9FUNG|nr:hypothetical protein AYI69_g9616 [Smittium culicis]
MASMACVLKHLVSRRCRLFANTSKTSRFFVDNREFPLFGSGIKFVAALFIGWFIDNCERSGKHRADGRCGVIIVILILSLSTSEPRFNMRFTSGMQFWNASSECGRYFCEERRDGEFAGSILM